MARNDEIVVTCWTVVEQLVPFWRFMWSCTNELSSFGLLVAYFKL